MSLREKVIKWLKLIGCTPIEDPDPGVDWRYRFDYPVGSPHQMYVYSPTGKPEVIGIMSPLSFTANYLEAFAKLDAEARSEFLWELRRVELGFEADFMWKEQGGRVEFPEQILTGITRFEDGLTCDSFAQSLGAVYKRELAALWLVMERLTPREFGGGGRFDFKTLGV